MKGTHPKWALAKINPVFILKVRSGNEILPIAVALPSGAMTDVPLRSEIEKALDELISHEEGNRFQTLAVILGKRRWPELIACEHKNDQGLDAHAPASLDKDGIGKGLACSITATLSKIKDDAQKVRKNFDDVKVLIFATPVKVTNLKARKWVAEIRQSYGLDLVVMPREDIITALSFPENARICQSILRIPVAVEEDVAALLLRAKAAAAEVVATWLKHTRIAGRPKLMLQAVRLDENGRETPDRHDLDGLHTALIEARRIILEAPAGRGKTTTLLHLAERLGSDGVSFIVDLPQWVNSGRDILEFVASSPPYRACNITASDLATLCGVGHCEFMLNGWNEVSAIHSGKAQALLSSLERDFPTAGIIVATRTHHVRPPLPGSTRMRLLPLSRSQRREYIQAALGERAEDLADQIDKEPVLDDLTRTPLILAEVTSIYKARGHTPSTKMGVLNDVLRLVEEAEEHQGPLAGAPLSGRGRTYLAHLATRMTADGCVIIDEEDTRATVHEVSVALISKGQIAGVPEPAAILEILSAHHVLERLEYPKVAFRFEHQQFQEVLAATEIEQQLYGLIRKGDAEGLRHFAREYLNRPVWEEPLRILAEEIGARSKGESGVEEHIKAGALLVTTALNIDPVFAADLSYLCGPDVWREAGSEVAVRLRAWYRSPDKRHQHCALAGMLATGSDDFIDIILPLLTSEDHQVRLRTYRTWGNFRLSTLGENWQKLVSGWNEEHRADFVTALAFEGRAPKEVEEFARTDPSPAVRMEAFRGLQWIGSDSSISRALAELDDNTFDQVLQGRLLGKIPDTLKSRALEAYQRLLTKHDDLPARLRIRLAAAELGANGVIEGMKEDLGNWPPGRIDSDHEPLLKAALEAVRSIDPEWVSLWVAERVRDDHLWSDRWTDLVLSIPSAMQGELLERLGSEELEYPAALGMTALLTQTADSQFAEDLFARLCSLRSQLLQIDGEIADLGVGEEAKRAEQQRLGAIFRQLEHLFHGIPPEVGVSGIFSHLSPGFDAVQYGLTVTLLGGVDSNDSDLRNDLSNDLRQRLRQYLKAGLSSVLTQEDFNGELKAELAMTLAQVGDPQDISDIHLLIQADIERRRRGLEARHRDPQSPQANGASMSWSNRYVRALAQLDPQRAEEVLLSLLQIPEYESDAAGALLQLARTEKEKEQATFVRDYSEVWQARTRTSASGFDETRRHRYAQALRERVLEIKQERLQVETPDYYNYRLKGLCGVLAALDGRESVDLVMEVLAFSGRWDSDSRLDALNALLFAGAAMDAEKVFRVLDPVIEEILTHRHDQQARFYLQRCLCLLPFVQPCSAGTARLKAVLDANAFAPYELREITTALGQSRCAEALDLLLGFATAGGDGFRSLASEWIDAVAMLNTSEPRRILLSLVDPDIVYPGLQPSFDYHQQEHLASRIAEIAGADPSVRDRLFALCAQELPPTKRLVLAHVIARLGTDSAIEAGLNLIHGEDIPYQLLQGIENLFLEKRPMDSGPSYTLEPRSAHQIKSRLFDMLMNDSCRKRAAWALLGHIEHWRLENGRPGTEPRHPEIDSGVPWPPVETANSWLCGPAIAQSS